MINYKYLVGIFLLILLASCKQEINLDEIYSKETNFKLTIYKGDKYNPDSTITKTINKYSEILDNLRLWTSKNSDGWKSSTASWSNPDISLIGSDFRLLIYNDGVVIAFTDKNGKPIQLVKKVNKSEFDFLTEK